MDFREILFRHSWSPEDKSSWLFWFLFILWNIYWRNWHKILYWHSWLPEGGCNPNGFSFFLQRHRDVNVCGFEWNVSVTMGWIVVKFGTDILAPLRMNCNNFGDPILRSKFHFVPHFGLWPNTCKANVIPISPSSALCLVLISKC